jgi:UDP-galactopyranose mutase
MKALIVGAGIAGLTTGVLLKRKGWDIRVLDCREQTGGNCHDYLQNGLYIHRFGPHIFHTGNQRVWKFVNEFASFTPYSHRVLAHTMLHDRPLPIPYSKETERQLGRELMDDEIRVAFFVKYSEKMWGCPFGWIPKAITGRVPLRRENNDTRYFLDIYQGMPAGGYFSLFGRMGGEIQPFNIDLGVTKDYWRSIYKDYDLTVFTGSLDEFYGLKFGPLLYRTIEFEFKHGQPQQEVAVINWCDSRPMTRSTDFSQFYNNKVDFTTICNEYPYQYTGQAGLVPSYPMRNFPEADKVLDMYLNLKQPDNVVFCGRLGTYKYMNMDATIEDTMQRLECKLGESLYG